MFCFYNPGHNGDIHYSREFVKDICKKLNTTAEYAMTCSTNLTKDINCLTNFPAADINAPNNSRIIKNLHISLEDETFFDQTSNTLFINTWVGSSHVKYLNQGGGCCLESCYLKFKHIFNDLDIPLNEKEFYVPEIDWSYYNVLNIDNFINTSSYSKFYLFCNGPVLSCQAHNIDLNPIIFQLALNNPNAAFILTDNSVKIELPNLFYTSDITKIKGCDLNEIGYLATKCNFIFGRASGPYCFSHTKQVLKDKTKTLMALCNNRNDGLWAPPETFKQEEKAKQLWTHQYDASMLFNEIQHNLN